MKKTRGFETLAILLFFTGGFASGYAFVFGTSTVNPFGLSGKRIGMLMSGEPGVRFKPRSAAIWREVAKNSILDVAGGDSVHTGPDVATAVRLEAGPTLEISPDSLVVFKSVSKSSGMVLKLVTGNLRFKFSPEVVAPVEIESQGRVYQVDPPLSDKGEAEEWVFKAPDHAGGDPVIESTSGERISFRQINEVSPTVIAVRPGPEPVRAVASEPEKTRSVAVRENLSALAVHPVNPAEIPVLDKASSPNRSPVRFWFGLDLNQFKIQGTDALTAAFGTILSNESPGIDLRVDFDLDDFGRISSGIRSTRYHLMGLKGSRRFSSDSVYRTEIEIDWQKKLGSDLEFGLGLGVDRDLFIRSEDETILIVESVPIVKPNIRVSYGLIERNRIRLSAEIGAGLCLPSAGPGYRVYTGWEGQLGSMITYRSLDDTRFIRGLMNYSLTSQDSSITTRTFQELVFGFQYGWSLGW